MLAKCIMSKPKVDTSPQAEQPTGLIDVVQLTIDQISKGALGASVSEWGDVETEIVINNEQWNDTFQASGNTPQYEITLQAKAYVNVNGADEKYIAWTDEFSGKGIDEIAPINDWVYVPPLPFEQQQEEDAINDATNDKNEILAITNPTDAENRVQIEIDYWYNIVQTSPFPEVMNNITYRAVSARDFFSELADGIAAGMHVSEVTDLMNKWEQYANEMKALPESSRIGIDKWWEQKGY